MRYEATSAPVRAADGDNPTRPLFDVVLLGWAPTAIPRRCFRNSPSLEEHEHWVVPVEVNPCHASH